MPIFAILQLASQVMVFLNTPTGQQLVGSQVKQVEDLAGVITGLVTQVVNGTHAGVQASAAAQTGVLGAGLGAGAAV